MDAHDRPSKLSEFALIPQLDEKLRVSASMAEEEDWGYHFSESQFPFPVLRNYIRYTYARLAEEEKIAVSLDNKWACFNTGLVTPNQEPLYVLFEENHFSDRRSFWHFSQFCRKGEFHLNRFPSLPYLAHYIDDTSKLVFDSKKDLRVNVEHMTSDKKERFPEPYCSMEEYGMLTLLNGAIENAKSRVQRNYKTAIPPYYDGSIQLLLPLCLSSPRQADLAMVVEDFGEFYRASTCLTLDWAYSNARVLARPDRDWLQP
jgi:hypothetical protein